MATLGVAVQKELAIERNLIAGAKGLSSAQGVRYASRLALGVTMGLIARRISQSEIVRHHCDIAQGPESDSNLPGSGLTRLRGNAVFQNCSAVLHADQCKRLSDAMGKNQQSGGFNGQAEGIDRLVGEPEQGNWKPGTDEATRTEVEHDTAHLVVRKLADGNVRQESPPFWRRLRFGQHAIEPWCMQG